MCQCTISICSSWFMSLTMLCQPTSLLLQHTHQLRHPLVSLASAMIRRWPTSSACEIPPQWCAPRVQSHHKGVHTTTHMNQSQHKGAPVIRQRQTSEKLGVAAAQRHLPGWVIPLANVLHCTHCNISTLLPQISQNVFNLTMY